MEKMTKKELIDWINFSYNDLLDYRIYIGGYYFTFDQINDFLAKKNSLEKRLTKVNHEINVLNTLKGHHALKDRTTALELMSRKLKPQADFITTKVSAINKHSESVNVPCTYDEFLYIYNQLNFMRDELECFNDFLLEEVQHVQEGDENSFFVFINDLLDDLRKQFRGEIIVQKVTVKLPKETKKTK